MDPEGEIRGAWRDVGIPRVWGMTGELFFAYCKGGNEKLIPQHAWCTVPVPLEAHCPACVPRMFSYMVVVFTARSVDDSDAVALSF